MLATFRARSPGRALGAILFYEAVWFFVWVLYTLVYHMRCSARARAPYAGPLLIVANHQSYLDPPLVVMCIQRHVSFMARAGLFRNRLFGAWISGLNSIPLNENAPDTAAIRLAIELLGQGRAVLIFPEGSRSEEGAMHQFKRGVWVLLSRARCPVVPVAVEGAFDAWPRSRALPRFWGQRLAAKVGDPIAPETLLTLGDREGLALLAGRIDRMRLDLRRQLRAASGGRYPAPGPGDRPLDARSEFGL